MNNGKIWDKTYERDFDTLPWNIEEIPIWFKEVINSGWVTPCNVLDIGCGLGNYANYLQKRGYNVTAIDFSSNAIKAAKNKFSNINFIEKDILDFNPNKKYDFIFEVSVLHHIKPEDREKYIKKIKKLSNINTKIMICCFDNKESHFKGAREYSSLETNTTIFPLSKREIKNLFKGEFVIENIKNIKFGKFEKNRKRLLAFMHPLTF